MRAADAALIMSKLPLAALMLVTIAAFLAVASFFGIVAVPDTVLLASRWGAIAALVAYAVRRRSLTTWILVSMVVGAAIGHDFPDVAVVAPGAQPDLPPAHPHDRGAAPVCHPGRRHRRPFQPAPGRPDGHQVAGLLRGGDDAGAAHRVGGDLDQPGRASASTSRRPPRRCAQPAQRTWQDIVLDIFPENIARSVADAEMLQIVVFSVLFGIALAMLSDERRRPMLAFTESLAETMFKFTGIVMMLAPIGVGAAIAYTVGHLGLGILVNLFMLLATFYVAVAVFIARGAAADRADRAGAAARLRPGGGRTGIDRVCDHQFGGGAAAGDGGDGAAWRAAPDRRVRDADRLQLQPRRQHALSVADGAVCRPGGRHRPDASASSSCCC